MVTLQALLPFSSERVVYRAFGYAVVAEPGLVALAFLPLVDGSLLGLVDGCPVPWEEACALIAAEACQPVELEAPQFGPMVARLAMLATEGWCLGELPQWQAVVFQHEPLGLRVGMSSDLAFGRALS